MVATDLKRVAEGFRKLFREMTRSAWNRRYEHATFEGAFTFIELDYRGSGFTGSKDLPDYGTVDAKVPEEVRDLMEDMLYGGPMWRNKDDNAGTAGSFTSFTAPYVHVSPWTTFLAFKSLECIARHIQSSGPLHWKSILHISSRYRSQLPFYASYDRPPAISSYHALLLELKFLYVLHPDPKIATLLSETHRRGTLVLNSYKSVAQPLNHAYSSLRHGFRRLTDEMSLEFRRLKTYLEKTNHPSHRLTLELHAIYRVFIKPAVSNPYHEWLCSKSTRCPPSGHDPAGSERLLLWHGTPLDSLIGILDLGLQIRRKNATLTGTMYGNGIYLADMSSKSASFCRYNQWNGEAVLLLCEADVGSQRMKCGRSVSNGHKVIQKMGGRKRCIQGLGKIGPRAWRQVGWAIDGPEGAIKMVRLYLAYFSF